MRWIGVFWLAGAALVVARADEEIVWPTPNTAYQEGRSLEAFIQPTESGQIESGLFGCVRNSGQRFHEALDLFPVERDRKGEARDPVFAMLSGTVRHINAVAGKSNYGRYVVIEHDRVQPAVISLYAHLASIGEGLQVGSRVVAGQAIGIMGRSAAGYAIPRERAHLHVEIGVRLSDDFERWYSGRGFTVRNEHGNFNGMNLVGFDLLDYLERRRGGQVEGIRDYLTRQPVAATVVVRTGAVPDYIRRYPEFLRGPLPSVGVAGWRIDFTWFGLPKAWWPLDDAEISRIRGGTRVIVFTDPELLARHPCQEVVRNRRGHVEPGDRMADALDLMFGGGAK